MDTDNKTKDTNTEKVLPFAVVTNQKLESVLPSIKITRAAYLETELTTCEDVFAGFNEIRAVTFSYGLSFITALMHYFSYGEVIVGCDAMVKTDMESLINLQTVVTNVKCHNTYLSQRIAKEELRLFVLQEFVSHRKMYLLKADDGRTRVVFSSANATMRAWDGTQDEHYIVFDEREAYETALAEFETLRDLSTDEILKNAVAIKEDCSNVGTLPICKNIKTHEALVVAQKPDEDEEYTYIAKTSEKVRKALREGATPASLQPVQKGGKILFTSEKIRNVEKDIKLHVEKKKEKRKHCPELIVDCSTKTAAYNGKEWDLSPSNESVRAVAEKMLKYIYGFRDCTGDVDSMLPEYWKILLYMFLCPVMGQVKKIWCDLGNTASRTLVFYLLVLGPSDSGKTHFVEMVQAVMLGKTLETLPENCFSVSKEKEKKGEYTIASLSSNVKGVPLFIDEMSNQYWKYAGNIVKFDKTVEGLEELQYRPGYVIVSNQITSVPKEVSKRVIVFDINIRFPDDYGINHNQVQHMIKELSGDNPFYREFIRRIFLKIDDFIADMYRKNEAEEEPDIYHFGSTILLEMFADLGMGVPEGLSDFDMFDFVGSKNRCKKSLNFLKSEFEHNPDNFIADVKRNVLTVDFSGYESKDCTKHMNLLVKELPVVLHCESRGKCVTMNLEAAEQQAGIKFRKKKTIGDLLPWRR